MIKVALEVLIEIVLPVFLIIGTGTLLDRCFKLDLRTLSKLNFYVFVPALLFIKLLEADLPEDNLMRIFLYSTAQMTIMFLLGWFIFSPASLSPSRKVMALASSVYNCGNYAIPLVIIAFGEEYIHIIAVVIMTQNVLVYTFGAGLLEGRSEGNLKVLLNLARFPVIYAVIIAFVLRGLEWNLVPQLYQPLSYLADGMVPIALITLGAQLSRSFGIKSLAPLSLVTCLRLVISPLLAMLMIPFFGLTGVTANILIIIAGMPVAVNVYILAEEYHQDQELASQGVFWTTLISAISLSVFLIFLRPD
jgi:predicted permease